MVNKREIRASRFLSALSAVVAAYVAVVVATLLGLAILSGAAPNQAPQEAWIHAIIVAVFAVVLPLRLRPARSGDVAALRAVGVICAVLLLVNAVEALIPGLFPGWMRVEMVLIALLMAAALVLVVLNPGRRLPTR